MNMEHINENVLGDPAITPSVSGSNLAQSGEDFRLPPIAPAHDPGPWHVCEYDNSFDVFSPEDGSPYVAGCVKDNPRAAANAKLIAAAPELLDALFVAAAWLTIEAKEHQERGNQGKCDACLREARRYEAIIAKATK